MSSPLHAITDADWKQYHNVSLAAMHNTTAATISQFRRVHGKPKGPRSPGSGRPNKFDLTQIEWDKSNNYNAEKLGCTPSYIAVLRRKRSQEPDFA